MLNVNHFKPGITFQSGSDIFIVLKAVHTKAARAQAHVKVKAKNLRSNTIVNLTFTGGAKIKPAIISKISAQFLYQNNDQLVFMNNTNYDQIELPAAQFTWEKNFLIPALNLELIYFKQECLNLLLPEKVSLKVTAAAPAVKGDTVGNSTKEITVETGFKPQVPLFIKAGEMVILDTSNGSYSGRVN